MPDIFLNCDLGEWESPEQTAALMAHLHIANIACGGHAGNLESIQLCAKLAESQRLHAISTGAHPGVATHDRGRSLPDSFSVEDFKELLEIQIQRYVGLADLNHIKLHGALYHLVENEEIYRQAFLNLVQHNYLISVVCPAGGQLAKAAEERELPMIPEVFLDRNYAANGQLLPRTHPQAMILDTQAVIDRLEQLCAHDTLLAIDGSVIELPTHYNCLTACVHSDSPNSLTILGAARNYIDTLCNTDELPT